MKRRSTMLSILFVFTLLSCSGSADWPQDAGEKQEVDGKAEEPPITPWECLNDRTCTIPLISAHRGLCGSEPENTIAAFLECQSMGVPMVELDTRETTDGIVVIMHDSSVERTTDGEQRFPGRTQVEELTLAEFKSLVIDAPGCDLPNAEPNRCHPPTLREALDRTAHWMLYDVDFKGGDPANLAQVLKDAGTTDRVLFFQSDLSSLRGYRAEIPEGVVMPRGSSVTDFETLLTEENSDLDLKWIHGDNHNITDVAAVLAPENVRLYVNAFDDVDSLLTSAITAKDAGDLDTAAAFYTKAWVVFETMRSDGASCFGTNFAHDFVEYLYPRGFGR